jgi:hypothetical protein
MEFPRPSTYVPFLRRFTDEKGREFDEAQQLYAWVRAHQDRFGETPATIGQRVYPHLSPFSEEVRSALILVMYDLIVGEEYLFEIEPPNFERMSLKEFVDYRNLLHRKQYFFLNQQKMLDLLHEGLVSILTGIGELLPRTQNPTPFTIPLGYTLAKPALVMDQILNTFLRDEYADCGMFRPTSNQMIRNLCAASGRDPDDQNSKKPLVRAPDSRFALNELADRYLADTTFHELFNTSVPLKLTHDDRMNHMHIVGGTGAGKTSLIENLILHDLASDDPPSLVIIDPHGDLIRRLVHADIGIEDRLIVIDPRDIHNPPALNVFAVNQERMKGYDEATREQVSAGVIQTFDYLFTGLLGADLTAKQGVFFRYVARLMLSLPETMGRNATILDMMKLMLDPTPYMDAIRALPEIPRDFFMQDFMSKTFAQTKEQIRYRLQAIIENPTIARLFTSPDTKIDLFQEMNRGSVILVDTAKDFLKGASSNFGRIFISLTLQAILERAAIKESQRKDTFLIVDEAASYFDSNIDDLLTDARKYRCGLVLAHQYLDQASSSLRASLAANSGAKFAAGLSAADARYMAPDMRTTADFINDQPRLHFAAHIRNVTPHAVSIPVGVGSIDRLPKMSPDDFDAFMLANRARVSLGSRGALPPPEPEPPAVTGHATMTIRKAVSPPPDEDISSEW